jgi:probable addiction module antidote protein
MTEKLYPYDAAEDLDTPAAIAEFMSGAMQTNDVAFIAHCLGIVARAQGMTKIAKAAGLSREQLYRSFGGHGNPMLKSTMAVMDALGVELTVRPKASAAPNKKAAKPKAKELAAHAA